MADLELGKHAVFFYPNVHDKHHVLFTFIQRGVEEELKGIYLCGKQGTKGIRFAMKDFGIDVLGSEKAGLLKIIDALEWFTEDGVFKASSVIEQQYRLLCESAPQSSIRGLRVVVEVDNLINGRFTSDLLVYESAIGHNIELPLTMVCAYPALYCSSGEEALLSEIRKSHAIVIFPDYVENLHKNIQS